MAIFFSSQLCLWDPSSTFNKDCRTIGWYKLNPSSGKYGLFCQTLTSNPSLYESLDFFIKASDLSLSFGFKTPPALTFLSTPDSSWLMRAAMHRQRYLILRIYTLFMQSQKQGQRCILQGADAAFSLPNTFQRLKSDKPQQTFIHISGFALSYRISLRWRYRMTFWRAFFILTACKSLKETPAWESQPLTLLLWQLKQNPRVRVSLSCEWSSVCSKQGPSDNPRLR